MVRCSCSALALFAILTFAGVGIECAQAEGLGLFPVRNFQPIQLLFLGMPGDRAAVIPKGTLDVRIELAETSSVFRDTSAQNSASMHFETLRSGLFFRYGLTDRLEVGLEIPAVHRYRGFMEGVITATERATTGLAPARNALGKSGYVYDFKKNGQPLFSGGEGDTGLGDITLSGKYRLLAEDARRPAVSARVALKVPSGDEERFFGSGHPDLGVGLALEKTFFEQWVAYGNVNGIFPTGKVSGLTLKPAMSALAALEYLWTRDFSLVAQFDYYSSPFHGTGSPILDRGVTEVAAGFNYRLRSHMLWQVYGVESVDFITGGAADFTLATVVTYRFH
ncbi:MAG TPA: DUF3187 family protein [Nitrospiraceae bacterium]